MGEPSGKCGDNEAMLAYVLCIMSMMFWKVWKSVEV